MAIGDRTEKRLVGPVALTNANASVGSAVPASRAWVIKLAVGTAATASNRFFSALPIAGGDTIIWDTALTLTAGEQLFGYADTGSVVTVTAVGWEKEV